MKCKSNKNIACILENPLKKQRGRSCFGSFSEKHVVFVYMKLSIFGTFSNCFLLLIFVSPLVRFSFFYFRLLLGGLLICFDLNFWFYFIDHPYPLSYSHHCIFWLSLFYIASISYLSFSFFLIPVFFIFFSLMLFLSLFMFGYSLVF